MQNCMNFEVFAKANTFSKVVGKSFEELKIFEIFIVSLTFVLGRIRVS